MAVLLYIPLCRLVLGFLVVVPTYTLHAGDSINRLWRVYSGTSTSVCTVGLLLVCVQWDLY